MPTPRQREGAERLRLLYSLLPGLPETNFDLSTWRTDGSRGIQATGHRCGTTACAVGWASMHPQFRDWGLYYDDGAIMFLGPEYERRGIERDEWDGAATLFRVTVTQAMYLFGARDYEYPDLRKCTASESTQCAI